MDSDKKFIVSLKFKKPHVEKLLDLRQKVKPMYKFVNKYGKILDLLDVSVNFGALVALSQYYDPSFRCFTFREFQLVPTIEEFERILGWPLKDDIPFIDLGEKVVPEKLAASLCLPIYDVVSLLRENGILKEKLQFKADELSDKKEHQDAFNAVVALLVFGVVLFPNKYDHYITNYAINVFLAKNPVPTLVADVLYHHHLRYEKKKGNVLCCVPLLFQWLQSHMPQRGPWVKILENMPWPQKLDALTLEAVSWYTPSWGRTKVIMSCGDFRNVPLIGSQGCINYNPVLALRQLGYPMEAKPKDNQLEAFLLEDFGKGDPTKLSKIKIAWTQIHRKDSELKKRQSPNEESYHQWVVNRAKEIKLPHVRTVPFPHPEPTSIQALEEENDRFKEMLKRKDEEIAALQAKNTRYFLKMEKLETNLKETNEELKSRREQNVKDEALMMRYSEEIESSTVCIKDLHRQLRDAQQARGNAYLDEEKAIKKKEALSRRLGSRIVELEKDLDESNSRLKHEIALKEEALISLEVELDKLATMAEELTTTKSERDNSRDAYSGLFKRCHSWVEEIERLNKMMKEKDEVISIQEDHNERYYRRYADLVDACNCLVIDVPWRLQSALEDVESSGVPPAVEHFLVLCKGVVERFQTAVKNLKPRRGQHF